MYALFGLQNIADAADDGTGYPQLNAETIIAADPDLIFLADTKCCGESLETVAARPGWADMSAVVNGNVFAMDDDIASRWGPRVVEYAQQVHDAVTAGRRPRRLTRPRVDAGTAPPPRCRRPSRSPRSSRRVDVGTVVRGRDRLGRRGRARRRP